MTQLHMKFSSLPPPEVAHWQWHHQWWGHNTHWSDIHSGLQNNGQTRVQFKHSSILAVQTHFSVGKLTFWYFQHTRHCPATQQCQYPQALTLNCVTSSSTLVQKSTTNTATFLLRNLKDCCMKSGITSAYFCYQAAVTSLWTTLKNSRSNAQESSDCSV